MIMYWFLNFQLILAVTSIYSQSQEIKFEHITQEQGLSTDLVTSCILQDRKGFMWFGNSEGLNKYDGYQFTVYKNDPDNPNNLSSSIIRSIQEDSEQAGLLWIGTGNGGLNRFDTKTEIFTHFKHDPVDSNSLSDNNIFPILEDSEQPGVIWIGTEKGGLNKFNSKTGRFTHYKHDPDDPNSISDNLVWTLFQDRSGILWVGTAEGGLNKFDRTTETFTHYEHDPYNPNSISHNWITAIYEDHSGRLWFGTFDGLYIFDPRLDPGEEAIFFRYKHDPNDQHSLSANNVSFIHKDRSGGMWLGTISGGLNKVILPNENCHERDNQKIELSFTPHKHDSRNPTSLNSNDLWSVCEDRWGTIWIATGQGGLNKFDPGKYKISHYKSDPDNPNSLSNKFVTSIYEDRSGFLWIGTLDGLNKFDQETRRFTQYTHDPDNPESFGGDGIISIFEDRSGTIWIGTWDGLNKFNRETDTFTHYTHDPEDPQSLSKNAVTTFYEDPNEAGKLLWIGTSMGGLNKFDRGTGKFSHYLHNPKNPNSLSHNNVIVIYKDYKGQFWIGTADGLNKFDPKMGVFNHYKHDPGDPNSLANNNVRLICVDPQQPEILWIGTEGGLDRFDLRTEVFRHYWDNDQLPSKTINDMLADDLGNLWIHTRNGLAKFNIESETFRNYDAHDGLKTAIYNYKALHWSKNSGEVYVAGRNGFYVFHPDSIKKNTDIPPVVITDFQIFNKPVAVGDKYSPLQKSITHTDEIVLGYDQNTLSFEFAALHYTAPEKNQYAYKMEGIDPEWVYTDATRCFVSYSQIKPGNYVFRVRGTNNDGVWNKEGTSIKIAIKPPWWKTTWAYISYTLFIIAVVFVVDRVQRRRLVTKERNASALREANLRAKIAESENKRKTKELEEARKLQLSMLPKELPQLPQLKISVYMKTATEVGGDYYDFNLADDGTLTTALGDATGHGMQAGTVVTIMKGLFTSDVERIDMESFMKQSSDAIKRIDIGRLMMAFSLLKIKENNVRISNAGMPPVYIFSKKSGSVEEILLEGMPLGAVKNFPYTITERKLSIGDTILMLSDGLAEQKNDHGEMFDYDRIQDIFQKSAKDPPDEIIKHLVSAGNNWMNGQEQDDDISLIVLQSK